MDRETLLALSKDDLIALIQAQAGQIEAQTVQISALLTRVIGKRGL